MWNTKGKPLLLTKQWALKTIVNREYPCSFSLSLCSAHYRTSSKAVPRRRNNEDKEQDFANKNNSNTRKDKQKKTTTYRQRVGELCSLYKQKRNNYNLAPVGFVFPGANVDFFSSYCFTLVPMNASCMLIIFWRTTILLFFLVLGMNDYLQTYFYNPNLFI